MELKVPKDHFHHRGTEDTEESDLYVFSVSSVPLWWNLLMAIVKLKIDVSGTVGNEAWQNLRQFDEIQSAACL